MRTYTLFKRRHFVALTATSGCLPNLELAVQRAEIDLTHNTVQSRNPLRVAAAAGHMHICEWLKQRGCFIGIELLTAASRAGSQEICNWLLNNGCPWSEYAVYAAAHGGHPTLIAWLLARKPLQALPPSNIYLMGRWLRVAT